MERDELWEVIGNLKDCLGAEQLLDALCMSLDSDTLEKHLHYIDRNYETNCFKN